MGTLTLPNGTVLTQVTRQSCLDRIAAIELESFGYSQTRIEPSTGKRADCSGWASYVLATPDEPPEIPGVYLNAYNTASFVTQHVLTRIDWTDLLPGDMIGYCAPTSPGNGGHIAVWMGGDRFPSGRFHVRDHGSGLGPKDRWVQWNGTSTGWLHPDHLAPWRYVAITEGEDMGAKDLLNEDVVPNRPWRPDFAANPNVRWEYAVTNTWDLAHAASEDVAAVKAELAEVKAILAELGGTSVLTQADIEAAVRAALAPGLHLPPAQP